MYKVVGPCVRFSQHGPLPLARCRWPSASGPLPLALRARRAALLRSVDDFHILSHSFLPGSLPPPSSATQGRRCGGEKKNFSRKYFDVLFFFFYHAPACKPAGAVLGSNLLKESRSFFFARYKKNSAIDQLLGPASWLDKSLRTHW